MFDLPDEDVRSTSMGVTGEDIQLSANAKSVFPYQIEAKSRAAIVIYQWYEQASKHGKEEPLLIIKQNRSKPLVVVDAEHFIKIIRELNGNRTEGL